MTASVAVVWSVWLTFMLVTDAWGLFEGGWPMSVTMAFGSFVAGATSEGGGAVAFPVMTLVFQLEPSVARDFSLMIQSIGMTAASYAIFRLRVPVDRTALIYGSLGGALGIVFAMEVVAPLVRPAYVKMFFVSFWAGFGYALYRIRRRAGRETRREIGAAPPRVIALLLGVGFVGGMVSGLTGSGLDISLFALLVLGFGLDERIATPTSVVLMAGNAVVGAVARAATPGAISAEAVDFWLVCIPVVVVGAPLGAWASAHLPRRLLVGFLLLVITVQLAGAWLLLPLDWTLATFSLVTIAAGVLGFGLLDRMGSRSLRRGGTRWQVTPAAAAHLDDAAGERVEARLVNIGTNGALLSLEAPPDTLTPPLQLVLPDGTVEGIRIPIAVRHHELDEEGRSAVGVQFRAQNAAVLRDVDRWRDAQSAEHTFVVGAST